MKTENLAIVMTDIVGYTQTTQNQSRQQNARLLANHNRILLPIVRHFRGEHIKSIGDALLLVFRSPTDAMLCAMAMQDALHEYNRHVPEAEQIHIRIAASAGEVRRTRHDVFGEAVNLTSRIESITPADEIYFSEAVYMAMNKAEVPAREAGLHELKGISGRIRLYQLPRFSTPRLVPVDVMEADDMADLAYPYGGAHFAAMQAAGSGRRWLAVVASVAVIAVALGVAVLWRQPAATVPAAPVTASAPAAPPAAAASATDPAPVAAQPPPAATAVKPKTRPMAAAAAKPADLSGLAYTRFSELRQARKDSLLNEQQYKSMNETLTRARDTEVAEARRAYRQDSISLQEYRERLQAIEDRYR